MSRVLVTGGAGFIGSRLAAYAAEGRSHFIKHFTYTSPIRSR